MYIETYDLTRSTAVLKVWARDFPADPKPHLWWADVHARAPDQQTLVENDYREALRRDPSLVRARLGLAEELRKCAPHRRGGGRVRAMSRPRARQRRLRTWVPAAT